jgi:hypothetical protein
MRYSCRRAHWFGTAHLVAGVFPRNRLHSRVRVAHFRRGHVLDRMHGTAPTLHTVDEFAVLHDKTAADQSMQRHAARAAAVERRNLRARVQRRVVKREVALEVDNGEIGVGAERNGALARLEAQ